MAEAAALSRGSIAYQARWHLLLVERSSGSRYAFCVAKPSESHVDCPETPPTGSPVELLKSAGGFTISASELGVLTNDLVGQLIRDEITPKS